MNGIFRNWQYNLWGAEKNKNVRTLVQTYSEFQDSDSRVWSQVWALLHARPYLTAWAGPSNSVDVADRQRPKSHPLSHPTEHQSCHSYCHDSSYVSMISNATAIVFNSSPFTVGRVYIPILNWSLCLKSKAMILSHRCRLGFLLQPPNSSPCLHYHSPFYPTPTIFPPILPVI